MGKSGWLTGCSAVTSSPHRLHDHNLAGSHNQQEEFSLFFQKLPKQLLKEEVNRGEMMQIYIYIY